MEKFNRYFLDTLKGHYADFNGKATREAFWYFMLFGTLLSLFFVTIDQNLLNPILGMNPAEAAKGGILQVVFSLILFVPSFAISMRRLHDIGRSGWWNLVALVPLLGILVLIYFWVQKSK